MYRPPEVNQMTTPMVLISFEETKELGVVKREPVYMDSFFCNFKTYGGTEKIENGVLIVEDTAIITTWFNPNFKSGSIVKRLTDGAIYEIIAEPENIEQRNMISKFKVRRVKGGA